MKEWLKHLRGPLECSTAVTTTNELQGQQHTGLERQIHKQLKKKRKKMMEWRDEEVRRGSLLIPSSQHEHEIKQNQAIKVNLNFLPSSSVLTSTYKKYTDQVEKNNQRFKTVRPIWTTHSFSSRLKVRQVGRRHRRGIKKKKKGTSLRQNIWVSKAER